MHAIGEGAFRESHQRLVDAVRALAITARYLSGLEHAGDRAILTTDVEIETIKRRAAEVAKEARAHDSEPLAVLADQLSALAHWVHEVNEERVAVLFRWLFLVVLAVLNNVTPHTSAEDRVTVDIILGAWAAMNIAINVLLLRGYKPGKQFSLSTMTLDILFAAGLVYMSNGFSSPFFLALFLAVITNAVRFRATASAVSAVVIALISLFAAC